MVIMTALRNPVLVRIDELGRLLIVFQRLGDLQVRWRGEMNAEQEGPLILNYVFRGRASQISGPIIKCTMSDDS